ncbi:MAG: hypothetical protein ACPLZF_04060 [Nitrososphaeria archaeon]
MQTAKPLADSLKSVEVSSECPHVNVVKDYSSGELVCVNCGAVLGYEMEPSYVQRRSSAELERNMLDKTNIIPDEYTAYEGRVEDVERFYDSLSKTLLLPRSVYSTAVQLARTVLKSRMDYGGQLKLRTWEIAYPCLVKACEMHGIPLSRKDIVETMVRGKYVERDDLKNGFKCFSRILKACGESLPTVSAERFLERFLSTLKGGTFMQVLERELFYSDVPVNVFLAELEKEAKHIVCKIKGFSETTAAAVALSIALDRVCEKYSVHKFEANFLSSFLEVPNLEGKKRKVQERIEHGTC